MPAAWRTGDFSNLLDPVYSGVAGGIQLYNPLSVNATTGARTPFPNNQIPVGLINIVAKNLFANPNIYPLPTLSQRTSDGQQLLLHFFQLREVRPGRFQAGL